MLVLPETHADEAAHIAEKLRQGIAQIEVHSVDRVTCSMGVSQYKAGEGCFCFMKRVDAAMYRAKSAGRNRVMVETA